MFTRKRREPSNTPFPHSDDCRTRDAELVWERVEEGHYQRVCSCHTEHRRIAAERPPAPDVGWHRHATDENDAPCTATAKVVWVEDGEYWKTRCRECGTTQVYWQQERRVMLDGSVEPLPVGVVPVSGGAA